MSSELLVEGVVLAVGSSSHFEVSVPLRRLIISGISTGDEGLSSDFMSKIILRLSPVSLVPEVIDLLVTKTVAVGPGSGSLLSVRVMLVMVVVS